MGVIIIAFLFGPIGLCVVGFCCHPILGIIAVVNLIVNIVLFKKKQEGQAGCLWLSSGLLALILGCCSRAGLLQ